MAQVVSAAEADAVIAGLGTALGQGDRLAGPARADRQAADRPGPDRPGPDRQWIALSEAAGRVLAEPVVSGLDFPHWDNSAMDGYAVRFADVAEASAENPVTLAVVEDIPAGAVPRRSIESGQAARILTGAMMPEGADTIVIQERTARSGDRVQILAAPEPQAFVRRQGQFHQAGQILLAAGTRLSAAAVAVLAAAQVVQVPVLRKLRVAILSTGDELVAPGQPSARGQIVDSNQAALAVLVRQAGAEAICLGIAPDEPGALKARMAAAIAQADVVLSSGGVSVGDYDFVDGLLRDLGATLHIRAVAVKPGKPLTVATVPIAEKGQNRSVLYFGLPGNPVSSLVSFWRFVRPALDRLSGQLGGGLRWVSLPIGAEVRGDRHRETYVWGQLSALPVSGSDLPVLTFVPAMGSHSSGNLINLAQTNALARVAVGVDRLEPGAVVSVLLV